ncbi:MAG: response regulator [bacterium]|nr:response regulator [bacterium]
MESRHDSVDNVKHERILIIDDNPANLSVLDDFLKTHGLVTLIATDGELGVQRAEYIRPDLILLDVVMPGIDGFETCRRLKANEATRKIPVIFMTALASTEDKLKGFDVGGVDYITKPIELKEVLARVTTQLRLRDLSRNLEHRVQERTRELTAVNQRLEREILERQKAEQEREDLIQELGAKNVELERFTYTVSHDLKSPLITIKGFLGMLERDAFAGDTEQMKSDMRYIAGAADKMYQLLEELLELSRIGRIANPPEEFPLAEIVRQALESIAGRLSQQNIRVEIAPDLPLVYGDRTRLREVFENVIDNAAKFTGEQPEPSIEIGVRENEGEHVLYVKDNGIGIDPAYHEKVFGLFERLNATTDGTGVGLVTVKRIIEFHHGRIWVESEGIGKGTTICFTLRNGH